MSSHHRFKIGSIDAVVMSLGTSPVNIMALFGDIPAEEREAALQKHGISGENFIFDLNILYLENGDQRILVDTGLPDGMVAGVEPLLSTLSSIGVESDSITHIFLTHTDFDHIGGLVNQNGELNYPNARYTMWKDEWDEWMLPERSGQKDEQRVSMVRQLLSPIRDRINLIESEGESMPGISVIAAPGHTVGHIVVLIQSGDESLIHAVDAVHVPIQVENASWSPSFDADKDISRETRHQVLGRAARENLIMMAYHFPFPALGHVVEVDGKWKWQPI
jgi:glyoxylase-like metal-dependent hydrolase (beta-lactamase superfamily II)